jgi:hypothetical protein
VRFVCKASRLLWIKGEHLLYSKISVFAVFTETLVTKFVKRYQLCVLCNNIQLLPALKVNNYDVHRKCRCRIVNLPHSKPSSDYLEHVYIIYIIYCHTAIENPSDPIGYLLDFTNPYYTPLAGNMKARAKKDNSF